MRHTWYTLDNESYIEARINDMLFQTKMRLSSDREVNTRSIYTLLDWLGDIGGLLDALKYIGQMLMFPFFKFVRGDPISHGLVTSLFKRDSK